MPILPPKSMGSQGKEKTFRGSNGIMLRIKMQIIIEHGLFLKRPCPLHFPTNVK